MLVATKALTTIVSERDSQIVSVGLIRSFTISKVAMPIAIASVTITSGTTNCLESRISRPSTGANIAANLWIT